MFLQPSKTGQVPGNGNKNIKTPKNEMIYKKAKELLNKLESVMTAVKS